MGTSNGTDARGTVVGRRTRWTVVLVLLAAAACAAAALSGPGTAGRVEASPAPAVERWSGADRYATSAAISKRVFPNGSRGALVATGATFPDALVGGPVAATLDAPVLLTSRTTLPSVIADELRRLDPHYVLIAGSVGTVTDVVRSEIRAALPDAEIRRISGQSPYERAAMLSRVAYPRGAERVYLTTGENFPDALAAGPLAAGERAPVLLTRSTSVPAATRAELIRLDPSEVVILGGAQAVAGEVGSVVRGTVDVSTSRLAGASRYETSVKVSQGLNPRSGGTVLVATGENYPDALAAGPAAYASAAPILLVKNDCTPRTVRNRLSELSAERIVILGGPSAVSPRALDTLC